MVFSDSVPVRGRYRTANTLGENNFGSQHKRKIKKRSSPPADVAVRFIRRDDGHTYRQVRSASEAPVRAKRRIVKNVICTFC
jgi:hypothetical protein